MMAITTWLDETQVNTTPLPFTGVATTETKIIQLTNGNLLISWRSNADIGAAAAPGSDIIGRIFSPFGDPVGGEFRLNASASDGDEFNADIAATTNGGFVVLYESVTATTRALRLDEFDNMGVPVSTTTTPVASSPISSQSFAGPYDAQLAGSDPNSLLIMYRDAPTSLPSSQLATTYNASTNTFGSLIYVNSRSGDFVDVVQLEGGGYIPLQQSGNISSAFYRFDPATVPTASILPRLRGLIPSNDVLTFVDTLRTEQQPASIVALNGGGFAVAYSITFFDNNGFAGPVAGYDFTVRSFDSQGILTGNGDFRLLVRGTLRAQTPTLAALADGGFALAYRDAVGSLQAIDFSSTAQQRGTGIFDTVGTALIDVAHPQAIGLADGRFAVAWTISDGTSANIVLEILDTRVNGTVTTVTDPDGQIGSAADDNIVVAPGNTYIASGPGNDTLTSGATGVRLIGGSGDDIYIVQTNLDTIVEQVGGGTDTVRGAIPAYDLPENVESFVFTGTGSTVVGGNALGNRFSGGTAYDVFAGFGGDDVIDGGTGAANELIGGVGDDTYVSNALGDSIVELAGGGTDTIETALPIYVLRNQVENLRYTGGAGFLGIGNELANTITGGLGRDDLYGRGGNDIVTGGAGAANTLLGNAGDDLFIVAAVGDSVVEYAGEGIDTVETALSSFRLPTNVEHLTFTGTGSFIGFGNDLANIITGGASADTLSGFGGADRLIGGVGAADTLIGGTQDDVYVIGNNSGTSIVEVAGEGVDTVETTAAAYTLSAANVEILRFTGTGAFAGTGNDLDNVLYGAGGNDVLSGLGGADLIFGYGGNDIIRGGTGAADTLFGGLGNDVYFVDAAGTSVMESVSEGSDRVETTTSSFILPENVEHLKYIGGCNFTGTGSNGNDRIEGGGLADILSGGFGNDIIVGKSASDVLSGGAGADVFRYNGGELGIDQILDFTPGTDKLALALPSVDDAGFNRTTNIALVQGAGVTTATSADATFIYDSTTGQLSYDADGSRVGLSLVLATLTPGLSLSVGDFIFV